MAVTFELYALLAATALGLLHLSAASFSFKAQVGNRYMVGPRDEARKPTGTAARLHRANINFLETFPYFAACALSVQLAGTSGAISETGCILYLVGRVVFLPLYAFGVVWLRTISWNVATLGLVLVGFQCIVPKAVQAIQQ
jgi:uncharacterized MAPEG superfamily protein